MNNYPFKNSSKFKEEVSILLGEIKKRIDAYGFTLFPFEGDVSQGIPYGWVTIGFTAIGLPEIYISGMGPYSEATVDLDSRLRVLYESNRSNNCIIPNFQLCRDVNNSFAILPEGSPVDYQWRPVDSERLLYGQAIMLRRWLESEGRLDKFSAVQIVHRDEAGEFPMVSTSRQLLIDYVPFGTQIKEG